MSVLWLRVALVCYAVGLLYASIALTRTNELVNRVVLHAAYLGMIFHFVSLTEEILVTGKITLTSIHNTESALAFLIMIVFTGAVLVYRTTSPGIVVFPVVFLLTLLAATGDRPFLLASESVHRGWLFTHIALILVGYAALVLSFGASLLYLLQERSLKSKNVRGILSRLPALEIIDEIGFRSLLLGFPFMTLGLIAGTALAETTFGRVNFFDPKIFLSFLMWAVYLVLLYTRWNAGWRGRRAAYLASGAFLAAVLAWTANTLHRFVS
ncbi:MAG TPA: cytochrome c biogenesis protein CcsA [Terriglobales bacterium]|nr:cytochrome c biogenesis protein CcsA [Terriglobales bacterium]